VEEIEEIERKSWEREQDPLQDFMGLQPRHVTDYLISLLRPWYQGLGIEFEDVCAK
jgi:hypothetical protein